MAETPEKARAGTGPGPGRYVCIDCGHELHITDAEQDLVRCPTCSCEMYNCNSHPPHPT
ncbi:MAG: zinc ribbon-containing protein [Methanoculleaceae archaeon]